MARVGRRGWPMTSLGREVGFVRATCLEMKAPNPGMTVVMHAMVGPSVVVARVALHASLPEYSRLTW